MTIQPEKYRRFRALHERPGLFVMPNPWDAGSARILTALGFEALATTSAGLAFALGRRDGEGAVSRNETLANARAIVEATHLPVSADLENGFGHRPEDCADTIRMALAIGLAGGSIEDATGDAGHPIYEYEQAVERIAAAAAACRQSPFVLTARAENFLHGRQDLDDTIRRLEAYAEAGADVLYAPGLSSLEAVRTLCAAVTKPVNVLVGLSGAAFTVAELQAAGVKRISVGGALARAALGGLLRAGREIRERGTFTFTDSAMPFAEASAYMVKPKSS
jgi:2-methylisocitrate lyase-like PEP mutase family enzyme